jgi:hypothetical protein
LDFTLYLHRFRDHPDLINITIKKEYNIQSSPDGNLESKNYFRNESQPNHKDDTSEFTQIKARFPNTLQENSRNLELTNQIKELVSLTNKTINRLDSLEQFIGCIQEQQLATLDRMELETREKEYYRRILLVS